MMPPVYGSLRPYAPNTKRKSFERGKHAGEAPARGLRLAWIQSNQSVSHKEAIVPWSRLAKGFLFRELGVQRVIASYRVTGAGRGLRVLA